MCTAQTSNPRLSGQTKNSYSVTSSDKKVTSMSQERGCNSTKQELLLTEEQYRTFEYNCTVGVYKQLHKQGLLTDYQLDMLLRNLKA